uniref:Uncharacterized protein n=1 Tax=Pipistrellus kuhlii TaxID=59472 RepID=A0A7J7WDH9_PIPKU|nr:hypothetical protein mPipKuh1_008079 [Pipistrellus kuhlii]
MQLHPSQTTTFQREGWAWDCGPGRALCTALRAEAGSRLPHHLPVLPGPSAAGPRRRPEGVGSRTKGWLHRQQAVAVGKRAVIGHVGATWVHTQACRASSRASCFSRNSPPAGKLQKDTEYIQGVCSLFPLLPLAGLGSVAPTERGCSPRTRKVDLRGRKNCGLSFSFENYCWPGRCGSVVECRPMNQEVTVRFPVRTHARVVGMIPSVGCAGGG